jgi:hypothetical protein
MKLNKINIVKTKIDYSVNYIGKNWYKSAKKWKNSYLLTEIRKTTKSTIGISFMYPKLKKGCCKSVSCWPLYMILSEFESWGFVGSRWLKIFEKIQVILSCK